SLSPGGGGSTIARHAQHRGRGCRGVGGRLDGRLPEACVPRGPASLALRAVRVAAGPEHGDDGAGRLRPGASEPAGASAAPGQSVKPAAQTLPGGRVTVGRMFLLSGLLPPNFKVIL